jgi:hypothetical protein
VDPFLKKALFENTLSSPGNWYCQARELKAAADRLDYTKFPVYDEEDTVSHIGPYQMLLGFAFENLLKGLIIFFRLRAGESQTLLKTHFTHDLSRLANDPFCAPLHLTLAEIATLDRLSQYGIWAGRYPIPKSEADLAVVYHGSREYAAEQALWDRLTKFFHERAWIKKWDGTVCGSILMIKHPDPNYPDTSA